MAHENVDGKVSRLYVNESGCNIRLDTHGDRYFVLERGHNNYSATYSLVVAAAINRYSIRLRLRSYQPPDPPPDEVQYIVVDW